MNEKEILESERNEILAQLEGWLELPMLVLGFVWLALVVIDLTLGLGRPLELLALGIWALFILDFAVRLGVAPKKRLYLKRNWLTAVSLLVPGLRVLRAFSAVRLLQAARAAQGMRLVTVIGSLNRGMRALGATMSRRGFGYVMVLTLLVTLAGAAGMYALEDGLEDYATALWWTAMIMTTLGSDYWPQSGEGRILGLSLSVYAIAIFGYVTATLASFFIGRDAEANEGEVAGVKNIEALRAEIRELRAELRDLGRQRGDSG
jgi:voltage-gated potassium channel